MNIFYWKEIDSFSNTLFYAKGCGVSIGSFDGLHLGHRVLLEKLVNYGAKQKLPTGIITFSRPLPAIKHSGDYTGDISSLSQRLYYLEKLGMSNAEIIKKKVQKNVISEKTTDRKVLVPKNVNQQPTAEITKLIHEKLAKHVQKMFLFVIKTEMDVLMIEINALKFQDLHHENVALATLMKIRQKTHH